MELADRLEARVAKFGHQIKQAQVARLDGHVFGQRTLLDVIHAQPVVPLDVHFQIIGHAEFFDD